jgi:hypothetical protein
VSGVTPQNQNNVSATLTQAPGSPVAGLTSTTFVIGYTVAVAGAFSFTIFIANDDADENPYTITVSGTGIATPASEIDVQRPAGTSITSGGTDTQGDQTVGTAVALSYTVANQGNADLAVNGVTLQNQNNVRTAVNQTPDTSVTGSNSTLFSIEYTVIAAGAFSFDVVIANDDADENPYTITVSGTGIAVPVGEIDVQNPAGASIVSGSTDAQGNQAAGAVVTLSYTLANQGNADLVVDGVTIQNQNNVSAMITQTPASPVAGAGATTFIIEYTVAAAGAFSFDFVIANDDANENSYTITVSGTGSTVIISTLSTWALVVLSLLLGSFGALSRRAAGARL